MKKYRYKLNLQMFAGETSIQVGGETIEIDPEELTDDNEEFDIEDVDDDGEGELQSDDEDGQEDGQEHEEHEERENESERKEEVSKKEPDATAKAVIAERKKWQEKLEAAKKDAEKSNPLVQKMMRLINATDEADLQAKLDMAEAATIAKQHNISPEAAQLQLMQQREQERMKQELRNLKYENEAKELMRDPFYADLADYRDEFQQIAERTGMTLEEVYMSKRGKARMKEMEREIEQRVQANQSKRQKAKVDTTADGSSVKTPKVDLSPDLMAAAKLAVSMGHFKDVEEYANYHKKYGKK